MIASIPCHDCFLILPRLFPHFLWPIQHLIWPYICFHILSRLFLHSVMANSAFDMTVYLLAQFVMAAPTFCHGQLSLWYDRVIDHFHILSWLPPHSVMTLAGRRTLENCINRFFNENEPITCTQCKQSMFEQKDQRQINFPPSIYLNASDYVENNDEIPFMLNLILIQKLLKHNKFNVLWPSYALASPCISTLPHRVHFT